MNLHTQYTQISEYIRLFPEFHKRIYAKITKVDERGMILEMVKIHPKQAIHSQGAYKEGEMHFLPWEKLTFKYVSKEKALQKEPFKQI